MNKSDPPVCVVDDDSSIREAIEGLAQGGRDSSGDLLHGARIPDPSTRGAGGLSGSGRGPAGSKRA